MIHHSGRDAKHVPDWGVFLNGHWGEARKSIIGK
jgi:hypothetical protein